MKKWIINICMIVFVGNLQILIAQERVSSIRETLLNPHAEKVLVVAHRGDWRNAPENSLAAIESAIKMKVDIVELDVKRTKDGQLILMHDQSLERTTTGKGKVSDWMLDSIKTLKLKDGCGIKTKHTVPTLEEAMLVAKGKIMVNLDHAYSFFDEVYEVLQKTGTTSQVIMKGSKPVEIVKKEFGKYLNEVFYMPVVNLDKKDAQKEVENYLNRLHPIAFELVYRKADNPLPVKMKKILQGKSLIWYNTLWDTLAGGYDDDLALENPDKSYGYLINELGTRILQTDRPAYMLEYLKNKGLHD